MNLMVNSIYYKMFKYIFLIGFKSNISKPLPQIFDNLNNITTYSLVIF